MTKNDKLAKVGDTLRLRIFDDKVLSQEEQFTDLQNVKNKKVTEIDSQCQLVEKKVNGGISPYAEKNKHEKMILNLISKHSGTLETVRIDHQYDFGKLQFCSKLLESLKNSKIKTLSLRNFQMNDFDKITAILPTLTQLQEIDFSLSNLAKLQIIELMRALPKSVQSVNFLDTIKHSDSGFGGESIAKNKRLEIWKIIFNKNQFTHFGCDQMRSNELKLLLETQKNLQSIHLKEMGSNIKDLVKYSIDNKVRNIAVRSSRQNVGGTKHSESSAKEMIRLIKENHRLQSLNLLDSVICSGPSVFDALKETTSLQALQTNGNPAYNIDEKAQIEIAQNASLRQLAYIRTGSLTNNAFGIPKYPETQQTATTEINTILKQNRALHEAIYDAKKFGDIILGKTNPVTTWEYIGDDDASFNYNPENANSKLTTFIDARKETLKTLGKSEDEAQKMATEVAKHYVRHHNEHLFQSIFNERPAAYDEAHKVSKMSFFGRFFYTIWKVITNFFSTKAAATTGHVQLNNEKTLPPQHSGSVKPAEGIEENTQEKSKVREEKEKKDPHP